MVGSERARQTEPFDPDDYDDPEEADMERHSDKRRCAADLLLVERTRKWLLEERTRWLQPRLHPIREPYRVSLLAEWRDQIVAQIIFSRLAVDGFISLSAKDMQRGHY
jgi:hypothetical protein